MNGRGIYLIVVIANIGRALGQACESATYAFPNAQQITDVVQYTGGVPELVEATVCGVVDAERSSGWTAVLNYATADQSNEFLFIFSATTANVWVNGESKSFTTPFNLETQQFHFCAWLSSVDDQVGLYIDGSAVGIANRSVSVMRAGGILLLGQDRDNDDIDGFPRFDSRQAFSGTIANVHIWSRVLNATEVATMANHCTCPSDAVISFGNDNVLLHGDVTVGTPTCLSFTACQQIELSFPSGDQNTDHARFTGEFPAMSEVTACLWMETTDRAGRFVISYATESDDNALALSFSDTGAPTVWLQNNQATVDATITEQAHICFTIDTASGIVKVYVDGLEVGSTALTPGLRIESGGFFVVGQDQDAASIDNPRFEHPQSFVGKITNLAIWPRVLSSSEIYAVATRCDCPQDAAVFLTRQNTEVFGNLTIEIQCPNGEGQLRYSECSTSSFDFPGPNQDTDYLEVTEPIPDLRELTYCSWVTQTSTAIHGIRIFLSYASFNESNELFVGPTTTSYRFRIKDVLYDFPTTIQLNVARHICFTLSVNTQTLELYLDGELEGRLNYTGGMILGNGRMVFGQDQDSFSTDSDHGFDPLDSFSGVISNPTLWSRVLSPSEISDIATECTCPSSVLLFVSATSVNIFGSVTEAATTACQTLPGAGECLSNPCHRYANCLETDTSFNCTCTEGFTDDNGSCTDVDECVTNNGGCGNEATTYCHNTLGPHVECSCLHGYSGTPCSRYACESATYVFPNAQQITDIVQYTGEVPELAEATVCGVVDAERREYLTTILSYGVDGESNAILLIFFQSSLRVWINGEEHRFTAPFDLYTQQFYFCAWFSTGEVGLYINGKSLGVLTNLSPSHVLGGGILVLGQDRDNDDIHGFPDFDSTQAFKGTMSNVHIWSRVLSAAEVATMANQCSCPSDPVVTLTNTSTRLLGEVSVASPSCPQFFGCDVVEFDFPAIGQTGDYVLYSEDVPAMSELSSCVWVESAERDGRYVWSYAAGGKDNVLGLSFVTGDVITLEFQDEKLEFLAPITGDQVHLCFTIHTSTGGATLYVNGRSVGTGTFASTDPVIPGGHLVLGQDFDKDGVIDPKFDDTQSFGGKISNFVIWPRILSAIEIYNAATVCTCPTHFVVQLTNDNTQLFGNVTRNNPLGCQNGTQPITYGGCPNSVFEFPNDNQATDYVQYNEPFPKLSQFTYCSWNEPTNFDGDRDRVFFSYASFNRSHEMLMVEQTGFFRVRIKHAPYLFNSTKPLNALRHLCVTLSTVSQQIEMFFDGESGGALSYTDGNILGGGRLVFGQDHDSKSTDPDPGFQAQNSWSGRISGATFWPRVLTNDEIMNIAGRCSCPGDILISINGGNTVTFGSAYEASSQYCNTLSGFDACANPQCHVYASCHGHGTEFNCSCAKGFSGDGYTCSDADECTNGTNPCSSIGGVCTDQFASVSCACAPGYQGDGYVCEDVNECDLLTHECHPDASCSNNNGSYHCACKLGFSGDGNTCQDLNECLTNNGGCGDVSANECRNTNGSYECVCKSGYSDTPCVDIDECLTDNGGCGDLATSNCQNTPGSYNCSCLPGFAGSPCGDENECLTDNGGCGDVASSICINTPGSFECSCLPGYSGSPCTDVDECASDNGGCGDSASTNCQNTVGSFVCSCKAGYSGSPCTRDEPQTPQPQPDGGAVVVLCSSNEMRLSVPVSVVHQFSSQIGAMFLQNGSCTPSLTPDNATYIFSIRGNLAGQCGTQTERNGTHIVYKNEVRSSADPNQPIFTGSIFTIPFACAFPAVGNIISINYTVEIVTATVVPPGGGGAFRLFSQLFTDGTYQSSQTQTAFQTTDLLFVQVGIDTQDTSLAAVLNRCWATPSADLNDATQYDIITDRCPVPGAAAGTIVIQANGEGDQARFEVQAFAFSDDDILFLHCEVTVCHSDIDSCVPDCSANRKRRDVRLIASRRKRQSGGSVAYQTIGPLYRERTESDGGASSAAIIGGALGGVVVALVVVLVLVAVKIHAAGATGGLFGAAAAKNAILGSFNGLAGSKGVDNPAMMT